MKKWNQLFCLIKFPDCTDQLINKISIMEQEIIFELETLDKNIVNAVKTEFKTD